MANVSEPATGARRLLPGRLAAAIAEGLGGGAEINRSALVALAIRVLAAGLGYGTHVFLARMLGASEYGIYSYVWVWLTIGGFLASFGLSEAAIRFIAEYRDTGQSGTGRQFIKTSLAIVGASSSAIAATGAILLYLMADQIPAGYMLPALLALACLPVFALQDLLEGHALSFSWTGLAHVPPYVLRQALIILYLLVAVSAAMPATAATGILAVFLAGATATFVQLVLFLRRAARALPSAPGVRHTRLWMTTAFPMMLTNAFQLVLTFSDIIVLGMFVDSTTVALYFAATRVSSQVTAVQFAVTSAVAQRMAGLNATSNRSELYALIHRSARWIFWATLAVMAGVIALGWPLLWLFGREFTAAYPVLLLLSLGLLARASTGGAEDALKMLGHERAEFRAKAVSVAVNLVLNIGLIPFFGIYGAAIATGTSMVVYSVMLEVLMRRLVGTSSFIATLRE
jgi:O-antigen/teichoic acid export membrane protein